MGCIEELKFEILAKGITFKECREFITKYSPTIYHIQPGTKLFGEGIIGNPPIAVGTDGKNVVFPFVKPCHGTFILKIEDPDEAARLATIGLLPKKK
jgi:hypothetical protein